MLMKDHQPLLLKGQAGALRYIYTPLFKSLVTLPEGIRGSVAETLGWSLVRGKGRVEHGQTDDAAGITHEVWKLPV